MRTPSRARRKPRGGRTGSRGARSSRSSPGAASAAARRDPWARGSQARLNPRLRRHDVRDSARGIPGAPQGWGTGAVGCVGGGSRALAGGPGGTPGPVASPPRAVPSGPGRRRSGRAAAQQPERGHGQQGGDEQQHAGAHELERPVVRGGVEVAVEAGGAELLQFAPAARCRRVQARGVRPLAPGDQDALPDPQARARRALVRAADPGDRGPQVAAGRGAGRSTVRPGRRRPRPGRAGSGPGAVRRGPRRPVRPGPGPRGGVRPRRRWRRRTRAWRCRRGRRPRSTPSGAVRRAARSRR